MKDLIHTYDWAGECPVCHLVHTHETALCPNDGKPLVIALDATKYNPFGMPMETAHIRCSGNCGYTGSGILCNNDGTVISSVNLRFRMTLVRTVLHNLVFFVPSLLVTPIWLAAFYGIYIIYGFIIKMKDFEDDGGASTVSGFFASMLVSIPTVACWILGALVFYVVTNCWWPFRRTFDFDTTTRGPWIRKFSGLFEFIINIFQKSDR